MKKIIITAIVLVSIIAKSYAEDRKGFIGISVGPSIPIGDLASSDVNNDAAGFANTGGVFDISFAYQLGEGNYGITALLRGQANPTDAQAMADEFGSMFPTVNWTVESESWSIGGLLFGGFGSFPVSERTSFDARAMIGFLNAQSPEITITGTIPGESIWLKQGSQNATSFAYLLGAGFSFDIGERLLLLTNLDYLGSNPEFSNVEIIDSDGNRDTSTWSQVMGSINMSIGIALKL